MVRPGAIARSAGANLTRAARRVIARTATPRRGSVWIVIRLAPPLDDLAAPRLPFSRPGPPGLLDVLETLEAAGGDRLGGAVRAANPPG